MPSDLQRKTWFKPGQQQIPGSGRKAGTAGRVARLRAFAEALAARNDLPFSDPAEMLLIIAMTGRDPLEGVMNAELQNASPYRDEVADQIPSKTHTHPDGSVTVKGYVPIELRVDAARLVMPYLLPRLSSVELSAESGANLFKEKTELGRQLSADTDVRDLFERITAKAALIQAEEKKLLEVQPANPGEEPIEAQLIDQNPPVTPATPREE